MEIPITGLKGVLHEGKVEQYPFTRDNNHFLIKAAVGKQYRRALDVLRTPDAQKKELYLYAWAHLELAEKPFLEAEVARRKGLSYADAPYHDVVHGVYQTGYHTASNILALAQRREEDLLTSHLTPESVVAMLIGAPNHDIGYVIGAPGKSHAKERPGHVVKSMQASLDALDKVPAPAFLDLDRVRIYTPFSIHRTNFPFDDSRKAEMKGFLKEMDPRDRVVAMVAAATLQLADFGGQIACSDYFTRWLPLLRDEYNSEEPMKGTNIVGTNEQMQEKFHWFLDNMVMTTVGKTARAFYGTDNSYVQGWNRHLRRLSLAS